MTITPPLPLHWQQVLLSLDSCRIRSLTRPQSCELPGPDGTAMHYTLDEKHTDIERGVKAISPSEGRMLVEADASAGRDYPLVWLRPFFVHVLQTLTFPVNSHYLTEWLGTPWQPRPDRLVATVVSNHPAAVASTLYILTESLHGPDRPSSGHCGGPP